MLVYQRVIGDNNVQKTLNFEALAESETCCQAQPEKSQKSGEFSVVFFLKRDIWLWIHTY